MQGTQQRGGGRGSCGKNMVVAVLCCANTCPLQTQGKLVRAEIKGNSGVKTCKRLIGVQSGILNLISMRIEYIKAYLYL